jgi:predicted CopG family antitoxin
MTVKTTVLLNDEVYEHLVKKVGRRKISKTINEVLAHELFKPHKSMFGVDPWLTTKGLRDEEEPHESL